MNWLSASGGKSVGVSASGMIYFTIDWFDLLAVQETPKNLLQHHNSKASILWCSASVMVQLCIQYIDVYSHLYLTTGKIIALTLWTFVSKVMPLLFNTLSRFVTVFLLRSKRLLLFWLQSTSTVILGPKKTVCHCSHFFPHPFAMK